MIEEGRKKFQDYLVERTVTSMSAITLETEQEESSESTSAITPPAPPVGTPAPLHVSIDRDQRDEQPVGPFLFSQQMEQYQWVIVNSPVSPPP